MPQPKKVKIQVKSKPKSAQTPTPTPTPTLGPDGWKIQEIDVPAFNSIYHISDIHIRPLQRHEEFKTVFHELDNYLTSIKKSESSTVAVITGDIFDNKTVFRPETFKLCRDMMKMISSHMPLFVIAGNHDMMEKNTNRLDAITPVVDDIPNLHYLKYSGLYYCPSSNICFTVSSLYDKTFINYNEVKESAHYRSDYQYISLYHGTLNGAKTDTGYVVSDDQDQDSASASASASSRFRSIKDFDGFDAVLLGDIHKHQVMRQVPPIAYAGSLIQQNHGEDLDGHGVLKWSQVQQGGAWSCKLQDIKNHYGFVDIHCQDGEWTNTDIILPENCYARLVIKNCTETQIDVIIAALKTRVKTLNITKRQCISDQLDEFEIPPDIQRKEDELELIREQAEQNHYDADRLIELHQEYQETLDVDSKVMSTAVWRPVSLEFKNMFGYGSSVVNKMIFKRGTISITAGNTCGKTSIVNIILFAIFGRTPLNPSNTSYTYDIINNREDSGYVKILLNHGGQYYLIERRTIRKNSKAVTNAVLKKLNRYDFSCAIWESNIKGDKVKNCSELRKNNNDTFIKELFGDIGDFSLSNLLNKESSLDLLSMTPAEQIKVLKKIFKLEIYDSYKELNKSNLAQLEKDIAAISVERKTLEPLINNDITEELLQSKEQVIKVKTQSLNTLNSQLQALKKDKDSFQQAINTYRQKITPVNTKDLPQTEAEKDEHFLLLKDYLEPPVDTGVHLEALQYKLEDLQRQIDTVSGNIDSLSVILDIKELQDDLKTLKLQMAEVSDISINDTEANLNRKTGDLTSKLELTHAQLEELKIKNAEQMDLNMELDMDLDTLKSSLHKLSSNKEAIGKRLDEIDDLFGGQVYTVDINETDVQQQINDAMTEISGLQVSNRSFDSYRDHNLQLDLESIEQLQEQLVPDLPSVKYSVSVKDLETLEEQCKTYQDNINQISVHTLGELIEVLDHDNHDHDGDMCILHKDTVTSIQEHLINGENIKCMTDTLHVLNNKRDRVQEQINTNALIDNNKVINSKIAQLKYLENERQISQLKNSITVNREQLEKYRLYTEYLSLSKEEEKHFNNEELQIKIDYLESVAKSEQLIRHADALNQELEDIENKIYYLELKRNIELVETDLESHKRIDKLKTELSDLKKTYTETETQLQLQQQYNTYIQLQDITHRLEIYDKNQEIQGYIEEVQSDLDSIIMEIDQCEQDIVEQDNVIKDLKQHLSVLSYRHQEQESIKEKLHLAEERSIQLEHDIIPYKEYKNIIGTKGITSKLLYNKIKSIEGYINNITQKFTKYKILISYDDVKQQISIITENKSDGRFLSTTRLCGFEKLMLQIAFKRALNKFSYNSKSSLIIVDEAFDCIDQENFLTKLPEAINLITQDYSNCLAISQRDISHISDSIITIKQQNGSSRLLQ